MSYAEWVDECEWILSGSLSATPMQRFFYDIFFTILWVFCINFFICRIPNALYCHELALYQHADWGLTFENGNTRDFIAFRYNVLAHLVTLFYWLIIELLLSSWCFITALTTTAFADKFLNSSREWKSF